jgi:eukaryotic-like serine/threonine-protein kinase
VACCPPRGGDLPTEAQYEYAAGGLQSQLYVWGQDAPTCPDAVYARTSTSAETLTANIQDDCPAVGIGGPVPAGTGLLDQLIVPGGTVVDLAGDLAEWAADLWNQSSEACWSRPGIYTDPLCTTPSPADGRWYSTRGAGWLTEAVYLPAATRSYEAGDTAAVTSDAAPSVGFRCVRSARP